jgi:hypothetical protein
MKIECFEEFLQQNWDIFVKKRSKKKEAKMSYFTHLKAESTAHRSQVRQSRYKSN